MLILVLAGGLRFTGINFGLPYFENSDEPWFFYEAAFQRGLIGTWLHPNPSQGLIGLYKGLQIGVEALTGQTSLNYVSEITLALRNINAVASLVTLIVVALCARELGGDLAGLLAAGLWAVIPTVAFFSGNAIAESWMMLFAAIAAYFAVLALHRRVMAYALVSVWAGLFAFAFKYSMFSFAGLGVAATLWSYWANRGDRLLRGRWLRSLILHILSIGLFLGAIVALGGLHQ
jgi:dolichyl-phosphate-mannose--protein O-mannosyl transferase